MEEASSSSTLLSQHRVPIIDIAHITRELVCPVKSCTKQAASKLHKALMDTGYAFLVNHGITESKLQGAYCKYDTFCSLAEGTRCKYSTENDKSGNNLYKLPGQKVIGKLYEYKHEYLIKDVVVDMLPENEVPGFTKTVSSLIEDLKSLASVILQFVAIGCDVEPHYFLKHHFLNPEDEVDFEMVYYPPMDDCKPQKELTSDEHFDKGSFSIIAQDSEVGLEVLHNNKWYPVGCLPGALLLRAGICLQDWTAGVYKPTKYRMAVPNDNTILSRSRHSARLHVYPQNQDELEPLSITTYEFHAFCPNEPKNYCSLRRAYRYVRRKFRLLCR